MGTFVTDPTTDATDIFPDGDKVGQTIPVGLSVDNVMRGIEANAIRDALLDLRTDARATVHLRHYGAVGDGVTDDTASIRAAIAACPEGGRILGQQGKTYYITRQSDGQCLEITKALDLDWGGATILYRPYLVGDAAATHAPAIYIHGSSGTAYAISAATTRGDTVTTTTAADAGNLAAGDYVILDTSATKDAWNKPDGLYNTFGTAQEIQHVKSVNASTGLVTFSRRLDNLYPANATIRKVTLLRGPKVRNIGYASEVSQALASTASLTESVGHLISINRTIGASVTGIHAENFRMFAVWSSQNIAPHVFDVHGKTDGTFNDQGGHAYLVRHQACQGSLTWGCTGNEVRHLLDYTQSYDGLSWGNVMHRGNTAFITHGFGSRRIVSVDDAAFGSDEGWAIGNTAFGADYELSVRGFRYVGTGHGINVVSGCEDVEVLEPNIVIHGSGAVRPIGVSGGAKRVRLEGGIVDVSASTSASVSCIKAGGGLTPGYTEKQISTGSATAGVDAVVTIETTAAHGWSASQSIYIGLYDTALGEYEGTWTIATVPTTTSFTFVRTGTTTQNLSITSSPYRAVSASGNFKPIEDLTIRGMRLKAGASQSNAVEAGCEGAFRFVDNNIDWTGGAGNVLLFNDQATDSSPTVVDVTGNHVTGACATFFQLDRPPSVALIVDGNTCPVYTASFLTFAIPSQVTAADWHKLSRITKNTATGSSPTTGFTGIDLWLLVKNGGYVAGNQYPANAAVTHATNKNYEYGTFTPTIEGASTAGTASYTSQLGVYQLDGRLMTVRVRLAWNTFTGTGRMRIKTMPTSNSGAVVACSVAEVNGLTYTGLINPIWSTTTIQLRQNNAGTLEDIPVDASADIAITATLPLTGA